jgi:hypothetical protein
MNCEKCQELISDLLDGSLSRADELALNLHLEKCLDCLEVKQDLQSILGFCRAHRGEYSTPPNERAMWLRIRNLVEAELLPAGAATGRRSPVRVKSWSGWLGRSWELSLPQLAALVAAIVVVVSLATVVGMRRWQAGDFSGSPIAASTTQVLNVASTSVRDRMMQQQQMIDYWNQRIELNKARWNPQMRDTFDRNMKVIDQAVADSLSGLNQNPHDEVSEEMLNAALNEKLSLLKEFADL